MPVRAVLAVLATVMGVAMGASPLIQAVKVHRQRRSADVSLPFLFTIMLGGLTWLSYGLVLGNAALVISNAVGVTASATTIAVVRHWRATRADLPAVEPVSARASWRPSSWR